MMTVRFLVSLAFVFDVKIKAISHILILYERQCADKLLPMYQSLKKTGAVEVICDFCAIAFGVKEKIVVRQIPLVSEYKGHPSIEKWIKK